jgi:hypothetical protein
MPENTWYKSTYSAEAANCLEIATTPTRVLVRDSKKAAGARLAITSAAWAAFITYAVSSRH